MPFHRLTTPAYFGGLPSTHDEINNATTGNPAPASGQQVGGTYDGTYLTVPGDTATAANVNRGILALAQNDDFIDDILYASQPVPAYYAEAGSGQTTVNPNVAVFVGRAGVSNNQETRDLLVVALDSNGNEIVGAGGVRVVVSEIRDTTNSSNIVGVEVSGYHQRPVFHFNVAIPVGVTLHLHYLTRGTYASLVDPSGAGLMGAAAGRLLTNMGRQHAYTTPFTAGTVTWADSSSLAAVTVQTAVEEIVSSLQTSTGSERVGARTYIGAAVALSAGSIRSQLIQVADGVVGRTATNPMTHTNPFNFSHASLTTFEFASGADWESNLPNGSVFFDLGTVNEAFVIRDGGTTDYLRVTRGSSLTRITVGANTVVADAYASSANSIVTPDGATEARGLTIAPGFSAGGDGSYLSLRVGGRETAGGTYGHLLLNFNSNEGTDQRTTYVPTKSHLLAGSGAATPLEIAVGGSQSLGAQLTTNGIMLLECIIFARGDNAGAPNNKFGRFIRRATVERTAGTYALVGSVETVGTDQHNFADLGTTLGVTIVSTVSGPRIQVTPPSEGSDNAIWWGVMVPTAFGWTGSPDA